MSSLLSEAFSEMWRNRERSCDGRRWWGWASSPSTPPDGSGEAFLPILNWCQIWSYLKLNFLVRSGPCLICREQQHCRQQTPPYRWISKPEHFTIFVSNYPLCRPHTLQSCTSKLPASKICWSCSMLGKPVLTIQGTWLLLPMAMLGLLKASRRVVAATTMST